MHVSVIEEMYVPTLLFPPSTGTWWCLEHVMQAFVAPGTQECQALNSTELSLWALKEAQRSEIVPLIPL